jgi:DNA-binding winged helix-turn-helix (wHTH) protein
LIRNRERVASKDDLIAAIWGGRIVSESALTSRINAARCAIGDNGAEQRLIKTLTRKGIRFVGAVRQEPATETMTVVASREAATQRPNELSLPDKPSIAVLPFANLNGDPKQDYFSHGITEDITTELSRFPTSWSSDGILPSSTRVGQSIPDRSAGSWAHATC